MNKVSRARIIGIIIGIDVSRDWLDIHFLPEGQRLRFANTDEGHQQLIHLARPVGALVCFEGDEDQKTIVCLRWSLQLPTSRAAN